jgi:hypothetical protein
MNTYNCLTYLIDAFSQGEKNNFKRNQKKERNLILEEEKTITKLGIQKLRNCKEKRRNRNETKEEEKQKRKIKAKRE